MMIVSIRAALFDVDILADEQASWIWLCAALLCSHVLSLALSSEVLRPFGAAVISS